MGYNIFQALGDMSKSGGEYMGVLAQEQIRGKRLAEARAEKLEDRAYGETKTAEARALALSDKDAQYARQDKVTDETRAYNKGISDEDRLYNEEQDRIKTAEGNKKVTSESLFAPDGTAVMVMYDSNGNPTNVDPDTFKTLAKSRDPNGGLGGGGKKSVTELQFEMRAKDARAALGMLEELEGKENPYDPSSTISRIWDNTMSATGLTNWLASADGQSYKAASTKVVEAFLRTATGAAAPEPEQARYNYMLIPQAGDSPQTVATKRQLLTDSLASLEAAAGMSKQDTLRFVENAAKEAGLAPKEKVVRGRTFVQMNGEWFEKTERLR